MILNIDFGLKLSNYKWLKRFICLQWIIKKSSQYYILSSATIHCRSLPLINHFTNCTQCTVSRIHTFIYLLIFHTCDNVNFHGFIWGFKKNFDNLNNPFCFYKHGSSLLVYVLCIPFTLLYWILNPLDLLDTKGGYSSFPEIHLVYTPL